MPRQKPFDKRTATTYALVNRPQHDPRIHDSEASQHVFTEISGSVNKQRKIKQRGDLEEEFGLSGDLNNIRDNEGEAAEHGIYFDDTSYDYMQHLREVGNGGADTVWVEAPATNKSDKLKGKQRLEDALQQFRLDDDNVAAPIQATGFWGSSHDDQKDIPDELAGFNPDMDPRLREVLEALEDDAYVDYEDDMFAELTDKNANDGFDPEGDEAAAVDEDGWESDDTTKPVKEYNADESMDSTSSIHGAPPASALGNGDLMASLAKGKGLPNDETARRSKPQPPPSSAAISTSTLGRRKKRKGALTTSTGFSMSSSALARTETLSVLDERFDKLSAQYMDELPEEDEEGLDDNMSLASGATGVSRASKWGGSQVSEAPSLVSNLDSPSFNSIMDDFMQSPGGKKGKRMKKGGTAGFWGQQSGIDQLNEIRKGLGPARLSTRG